MTPQLILLAEPCCAPAGTRPGRDIYISGSNEMTEIPDLCLCRLVRASLPTDCGKHLHFPPRPWLTSIKGRVVVVEDCGCLHNGLYVGAVFLLTTLPPVVFSPVVSFNMFSLFSCPQPRARPLHCPLEKCQYCPGPGNTIFVSLGVIGNWAEQCTVIHWSW